MLETSQPWNSLFLACIAIHIREASGLFKCSFPAPTTATLETGLDLQPTGSPRLSGSGSSVDELSSKKTAAHQWSSARKSFLRVVAGISRMMDTFDKGRTNLAVKCQPDFIFRTPLSDAEVSLAKLGIAAGTPRALAYTASRQILSI